MLSKDMNKVACQYCGNEYSKSGIANHEKACSENPENKVDVVEVVEPKVEATPVKPLPTKLVEVKLKEKLECYIGDRYYRFKQGEVTKVPQNVKDILVRAGVLEAY